MIHIDIKGKLGNTYILYVYRIYIFIYIYIYTCRIGTGLEILRIHEYVERNILDLDIPVCVLIAEKDRSLDSLKVEEIVSKLSPEQYKFIKYPGKKYIILYLY